jgi:hypothetical protein
MKVNKAKDLIERVGWTFIQAYIALGAVDWIASGINLSLLHELYLSLGAAVAATIKVFVAQSVGSRGSGDAIPGGVVAPAAAPDAPIPGAAK